MVRSLAQWTKTLSFPSRLSPNRNSKDCSTLNATTSPIPPPTPPRNKNSNCATSRSSSSTVSSNSGTSTNSSNNNNNNNMPITELEQIVSFYNKFSQIKYVQQNKQHQIEFHSKNSGKTIIK